MNIRLTMRLAATVRLTTVRVRDGAGSRLGCFVLRAATVRVRDGAGSRFGRFALGVANVRVGGGVCLSACAIAVNGRSGAHLDCAFAGSDRDFRAHAGLTVAGMGAGDACERK